MEKIVLDTNILVSALIGRGDPRRIVELVFEGKLILFLSSAFMKEYRDVLSRPKFSGYPDFHTEAMNTIRILKVLAKTVEPITLLDVCSDKEDNKFLELAVDVKASHLITGNKKHYLHPFFQNIHVVSPSEFIRSRKG